MYIISQFSRICGLTVKALRYYDEQDILKPSYRDEQTLYRYYDEEDLKKALVIKQLRSLNFSISEIRETIKMVETDEDLTYVLQEKIEAIEHNMIQEKALIKKIHDCLTPSMQSERIQSYEIQLKDIPSVLVLSSRFHGKYDSISQYAPTLYKTAQSAVNGPLINCYYDEECVEDADMELCLPIKKGFSSGQLKSKLLPPVKAVSTIHYGEYSMLHYAYSALFTYVNEHNLSLLTPSREIYIKGPGIIFKGNPQKYVTEILLPVSTI